MEVVALLRWFSLYIKHVTPLPKGQFPKMYFAPSLPQSSDALWTDRGVDYRQTFGFLITWCSTNAFCWAVSTKSTVMGGQFGYMRSIISWPKLGADTSHVRQLVGFSLYMIFWFQRDLEEFETICLESFVIQNNHDFLWWFPAWGVPREMTIVSYHFSPVGRCSTRLFRGGIDWHDPLLSLALVFGQTLGDTFRVTAVVFNGHGCGIPEPPNKNHVFVFFNWIFSNVFWILVSCFVKNQATKNQEDFSWLLFVSPLRWNGHLSSLATESW